MTKQALVDLASRLGWTALQIVLAYVTTLVADIGPEWTLVIAPALSGAKSFVASKVGDPDTATFK